MILPNGSPRIIAIEVPVTTILSASERNFSDTTLTAAGDAIDQNTECVHATPIRDTINIPYEAEKADSITGYVVKEDGLREFQVTLGELTDDEREIILKGCLINYNRK